MAAALFSDAIEKLKSQYTDKYVAVDESRPELARFRGAVGQVKTVNMSGRALVQFLDYHLNVGWFDIDTSFLRVVDPPPKDAAAKSEAKHEKPAAKAAPPAGAKQTADAGAKKLSPLEMARMQGAPKAGAAPPAAEKPAKPAGEKKSVADVLAAARANKATEGAAPAAAAPTAPAAKKPAAPKAAPAAQPKSTADILAAARANKAAAASQAAAAPTEPPAPAQAAAPAPAAPTPAPPKPAAAAPSPSAGGPKKVDRASMSVAEMIAYCHAADAKK